MTDVAELDAAAAEARREVLDVLAGMAQAMATAMDAFEAIMAPGAEEGSPVEWPLERDLILERQQLAAFVATMKKLPPKVQEDIRRVYVNEMSAAKASSRYHLAELRTAPVLPETKIAAAELHERLEEVRRAALFDRDLKDALRPLAAGRWAW